MRGPSKRHIVIAAIDATQRAEFSLMATANIGNIRRAFRSRTRFDSARPSR
jgi:hypothetical protein